VKQLKPILHGRDHANGGPDPIPGLGAGGGALEWEDVGTSGTVDLTAYGSGSGTKFAACTHQQALLLSSVGALKSVTRSADQTRLLVTNAGVYTVSGLVEAGAYPPYIAHLRIGAFVAKNGTPLAGYTRQLGDAVSTGTNLVYETVPFVTQLSLAAGDGIGLQAVAAEGHAGNDWGSTATAGLQVQVGFYSLTVNRIG
jgi:hypothetical protein